MSTTSADIIHQSIPRLLLEKPLVALAAASDWPCIKSWDPDYLAERINGELQFRMGRKNQDSGKPQWECDATYINASVADFVSWTRGERQQSFSGFIPDKWWAYAAYMHMRENPLLSNLMDDILWPSIFPNLPVNGGSTFWLGNDQSHTGCHYDTYGINVVVQVFGRKRWILFPPSATPFLYPTRLPLEESSVFSRINFQCPDFLQYPLLLNLDTANVVTLEPGDVLYVPRHWWHFVESVDDPISCSVNLWVDQPELDSAVRCKEALTQIACFSMAKCSSDDSILSRLHASERVFADSSDWFSQLTGFISQAAKPVVQYSVTTEQVKQSSLKWKPLETRDIVEILPDSRRLNVPENPVKITTEKIVSAFLHPDVVDLVYSKLLE